jgi:hypothetical protein
MWTALEVLVLCPALVVLVHVTCTRTGFRRENAPQTKDAEANEAT